MTVRVYRFGADAPLDLDLAIQHLRAAHDLRNELVAIERGRRAALRELYATPEIQEAEQRVHDATRSDVKAARHALRSLRRARLAECTDECELIAQREHDMLAGARELARCGPATADDIFAAARQARSAPLYDDDALTSAGPRFVRWPEPVRGAPASTRREPLPEGQLCARNKAGASTTAEIYSRVDAYMRVDGEGKWRTLHLRVGSGRDADWLAVRVCFHRAIPDAARWKAARLSVRREGEREVWSVEITVDDPAPPTRSLDTTLSGAIALSWAWDVLADESIRVAEYLDTRGTRGEIILPARLARGLRKPSDLRALRDILWRSRDEEGEVDLSAITKIHALAIALRDRPAWLSQEIATMPLWRSQSRGRRLYRAWLASGYRLDSPAFLALREWADREDHLYRYESGVRGQLLRQRREWYRLHAAWIARTYRCALVSNHRLDREARFGADSDVRFLAAPNELRGAVQNALGDDAIEARWDKRERWLDRAIEAFSSPPLAAEMFVERKEKTGNAWAERKKRKQDKEAARNAVGNAAE